jgi:hypothetical protein
MRATLSAGSLARMIGCDRPDGPETRLADRDRTSARKETS